MNRIVKIRAKRKEGFRHKFALNESGMTILISKRWDCMVELKGDDASETV